MREGICYVVGAGVFIVPNDVPEKQDFIIAVDGGYQSVLNYRWEADLVIGDFDSLPCIPEHRNVVVLNKEKDDTDMQAALKVGLQRGFRIFYIYGGTGGRMEHTIANIQCLAFLSQNGAQGYLYGEDRIITAITDSDVTFPARRSGYISVFAHNGIAKGVYLKGLKYELDNYDIMNTYPIGVSNEFIGRESKIKVGDGTLILIYPYEGRE